MKRNLNLDLGSDRWKLLHSLVRQSQTEQFDPVLFRFHYRVSRAIGCCEVELSKVTSRPAGLNRDHSNAASISNGFHCPVPSGSFKILDLHFVIACIELIFEETGK
jgi:hypothetical protein